MPRSRKIKTVKTPIFTDVGVLWYDRPKNLSADVEVVAISVNDSIIVARAKLAQLLHLEARSIHSHAMEIHSPSPVLTDETVPVGRTARRKATRKSPDALVQKIRELNSETPKARKARLAKLAEKARLRRAAKKKSK